MLLEGNNLILYAVAAENTNISPSNWTCMPECSQDYFCDTRNDEGAVLKEAHCEPCNNICLNFTQENQVNRTPLCREKCPGKLQKN